MAILCKICGHQGLLPRSVQIPLCYDRTDAPLYHGGFAEVWKGEHQGHEVAVKVIKIYKTSDLVKIKRVSSVFRRVRVYLLTLEYRGSAKRL